VLLVRLPCRKIYPIGPVYVAAALRRAAPLLPLRLLDLALIDPASRKKCLKEAIAGFRPDVVAFSWRDVQVFSPQDMDGAMRDAFTFFYDPSPFRKARAAVAGLLPQRPLGQSLPHSRGPQNRSIGAHCRGRAGYQDI
jgi:hypothetical protein